MTARQTILAPAKINLYLHVTDRRDDGYHDLDSLAVFASIGDKLSIDPAPDFQLFIQGPYASAFTAQERDSTLLSSNLVTRAVTALAGAVNRKPHYRITLTKNLPLASGLGGGSADAAAVIWGLMALWDIPVSAPFMPGLLRDLGADVPACLRCAPVRFTGIGDVLEDLQDFLPEMPVVLVNPGKPCSTPDVFRNYKGSFSASAPPPALQTGDQLIDFLQAQKNDLTSAAISIVPEIGDVIELVSREKGCRLSRMSGSGATVFGLFTNMEDAVQAAENITMAHPRWWVRVGTINSPGRY